MQQIYFTLLDTCMFCVSTRDRERERENRRRKNGNGKKERERERERESTGDRVCHYWHLVVSIYLIHQGKT